MKIIRANQVQNLWGSARAVAVSNVDIADAPSTIDGVLLAGGDRVLLTGQTDPVQNGIYIFVEGAPDTLARPTHDKNLATGAENTLGASVVVAEGTAMGGTFWFLAGTDGTLGGYENTVAVIGTDEMTFARTGVEAKELDFGTSDLSGAINQVNTVYALGAAYANGTVMRVAVNGVVANEGVDFSVAGGNITMTTALQTGDTVTALVLY